MKKIKEIFKSIFCENEFVVALVDAEGQIIDGYVSPGISREDTIAEAVRYFESQNEFLLFS